MALHIAPRVDLDGTRRHAFVLLKMLENVIRLISVHSCAFLLSALNMSGGARPSDTDTLVWVKLDHLPLLLAMMV